MQAGGFLSILLAIGLADGQQAGTPEPAKFIGVAERPIESDGKIQRLEVSAQVQVNVAGTYRLSFELTSRDGAGLIGHAQARLEVGRQSLTGLIQGEDIARYFDQDGPYTISDVRLFRETGAGDATLTAEFGRSVPTAPYRLADLYRNPYSFTGEVEAEGIDRQPSGKFAALRVSIGVNTQGGTCWGNGVLLDPAGKEIELVNTEESKTLPRGRGTIDLVFDGAKIARRGMDGAFTISGVVLSCQENSSRRGGIEERAKYRTPRLRTAEFDDPAPDFEFSLREPSYKTPASGNTLTTQVRIKTIGLSDEPVQLTVTSSDSRLKTTPESPKQFNTAGLSRYTIPTTLLFTIPRDLPAGTYPVRVIGRRGGHEHSIEFSIIVDAQWTRMIREHEQGLADLKQPESPPAAPPTLPSSVDSDTGLGARFAADVGLRKIHAVLVIDRSTAARFVAGCEFINAAAIRLSRLFVEGRDSLAVIGIGTNAATLLPLTDHFQSRIDARIQQVPCEGLGANMGAALEQARRELAAHPAPEAVNAVILVTAGHPDSFAANLSVLKREDGTFCDESQGGPVSAVILNRYDGSPTGPMGPAFLPADFSDPLEPESGKDRRNWWERRPHFKPSSCFGFPHWRTKETYAAFPETDINGVPLTGHAGLERFTTGPHAGQIRTDVHTNLTHAAENQTMNIAREIRSGPHAAVVYVVGMSRLLPTLWLAGWTQFYRNLANQPNTGFYDPDQPSGLGITVFRPQEIWPAFERIRNHLVERATIK